MLSTRAMLAHMRDDLAALEHDARRGAELFRELGDDWGVLQATDWLIGLADLTGDHAEAARLGREEPADRRGAGAVGRRGGPAGVAGVAVGAGRGLPDGP